MVEEEKGEISEGDRKDYEAKQIIHHTKLFTKISVFLGVIILLIIFSYIFVNSAKNFEYRGLTGDVVKEGELIFYQTSVPVINDGKLVPYNFYLRNNPEKLDKIPFEADNFKLYKKVVLKEEGDLRCEGKGVIAVANLAKLYQVLGAEIIKDQEAECDPAGRYMLLTLKESDKTWIEEVGPGCYNVNVKNCEVLEALERLMVEAFVQVHEYNN